MLVHGLGGSRHDWDPLVRELVQHPDPRLPDLALASVDLPGYGESLPEPERGHGLGALTDALVEYLDGLAPARVHLVGNSMGGLIALLVAASRPDLLGSLSLVSPAMPSRRVGRGAMGLSLLGVPAVGERLMQRMGAVEAAELVRLELARVVPNPSSLPDWWVERVVLERDRRRAEPDAEAAFLGSLRSMLSLVLSGRGTYPWRLAATTSTPTLVLLGTEDRLVHVSTGRSWRRARPDSSVVVMPATGHIAMVERPGVVASLLAEHWLAAGTAAPSRGEPAGTSNAPAGVGAGSGS